MYQSLYLQRCKFLPKKEIALRIYVYTNIYLRGNYKWIKYLTRSRFLWCAVCTIIKRGKMHTGHLTFKVYLAKKNINKTIRVADLKFS